MAGEPMATSSQPSSSRQAHKDVLLGGGGQVLADVVGADGQLTMAAVGEHGQLDAVGAPVVEQGVDGGPDGPPGDRAHRRHHDGAPGDVEVDMGGVHDGCAGPVADGPREHVVAVEADVEVAERHGGLEQLLEHGRAADRRGLRRDGGCRRAQGALSRRRDCARRPRARCARALAGHRPRGGQPCCWARLSNPSWPHGTGLKEPVECIRAARRAGHRGRRRHVAGRRPGRCRSGRLIGGATIGPADEHGWTTLGEGHVDRVEVTRALGRREQLAGLARAARRRHSGLRGG